ncbi:uncharacterized protein LOC108673430 [Hyalella azteca]|uniref:Uncharacterized protein LOC108673430 n=1 Tax=Hyalella azteca TaxID=294128 RepID=A0A8B7NSQ9_HYAAZ|nr:uncharacterized protein LOC108673430 [Hyalella azteca]
MPISEETMYYESLAVRENDRIELVREGCNKKIKGDMEDQDFISMIEDGQSVYNVCAPVTTVLDIENEQKSTGPLLFETKLQQQIQDSRWVQEILSNEKELKALLSRDDVDFSRTAEPARINDEKLETVVEQDEVVLTPTHEVKDKIDACSPDAQRMSDCNISGTESEDVELIDLTNGALPSPNTSGNSVPDELLNCIEQDQWQKKLVKRKIVNVDELLENVGMKLLLLESPKSLMEQSLGH